MVVLPEDVLKLLVSVVVGGFIGAEREFHDKAAGFRTLILICGGATLFTIFSQKLGADVNPAQIAAATVTGVGFLGAGVILRGDKGKILGLTTAASVWLTAALGIGIGIGQYLFVGITTVVMLVVLYILPRVEQWIDGFWARRVYEVVSPVNSEKYQELDALFARSGLRVLERRRAKSGSDMTCSWEVTGSPRLHERLVERLINDTQLKEFRF